MKNFAFALALGLTLIAGALPAAAQSTGAPPVRIRGTIEAVNGDVLTIATAAGGPVKVTLAPNATIRVVTKVDLKDIKEGSFVGVTSVQNPDGTTVAKEVHVFPPAQAAQKPGEGSRPWDLLPQSTMTNATVTAAVPGKFDGVDARTITLTYPAGEKKIVVPLGTPIVTYVNADRSALAPGVKIAIFSAVKTDDGLSAASVTAGRNGVDPPM